MEVDGCLSPHIHGNVIQSCDLEGISVLDCNAFRVMSNYLESNAQESGTREVYLGSAATDGSRYGVFTSNHLGNTQTGVDGVFADYLIFSGIGVNRYDVQGEPINITNDADRVVITDWQAQPGSDLAVTGSARFPRRNIIYNFGTGNLGRLEPGFIYIDFDAGDAYVEAPNGDQYSWSLTTV